MEKKQRYTFKKEERLKSRKLIDQLFKEGKSFSNFPFRVVWLFTDKQDAVLKTGFTVSSRHFKRAVDRNRVKRLMREAYRLQKKGLHQQLVEQQKQLAVFIMYIGNELPEYESVFVKTGSVLNRLIKIINENPAADT